MKLYYAPHTCALSPHIVLRELRLNFALVRVDNQRKQTEDGRNFLDINPKGYVAALELEDGRVLTEGPAILQYLADLAPAAGLAPPAGSWERLRLQEWLNFISSEIHAGAAPLFNVDLPEAVKTLFRDKLRKRIDLLARSLSGQDYLLDHAFGVADAYLFTVLLWCPRFSIDLGDWPAVARYQERIGARPAVREALRVEALA